METKRTHDQFYISEDRSKNPKEYFKFIHEKIPFSLEKKKIIDIGCAGGDFLYFLKTKYKNLDLTALDIDRELIKATLKKVPSIKKSYVDTITNQNLNIGRYDIIFMLGVHSIFDDLQWINNIKKIMKNKSSIAYIFGIFNSFNIDVIIKSRAAPDGEHWEKGWNNFSKKSISNKANKIGLDCEFKDFHINIDIPQNNDDALRSWTLNLENKEKVVINGLGLIHNFSLCKLSNL